MAIELKRGMLPWQPEDVKLKMSSYVTPLPMVPKTFGHVRSAAPSGGWGMLGNDQVGDCVLAGAAHEQMVWAWATDTTVPRFTGTDVITQYHYLTGGQDTGLDPIAVARWRCTNGFVDTDGVIHKIKAYASVANRVEAEVAVYLFGACGLGLALPDTAEEQFQGREPWDDLDSMSDPKKGHYVPMVGKNSRGNYMVVTWGRLQAMTPQYFDRYVVGGLCYFSLEYLTATGKSPELFDEAQLDADLAALGG